VSCGLRAFLLYGLKLQRLSCDQRRRGPSRAQINNIGIRRLSRPLPQRALLLPSLWGQTGEDRAPGQDATVADEEALNRLKSQDKEALALLYERHAQLVLKIAFRVLRDAGEAEELMHTVFLHLYQKAELFDAAKGGGKAWIVQTAYHRALDRREYLEHRQFYSGTDSAQLADTVSGGSNVEREVGARLDREQLLKAIEELPENQRQTLTLYFFEGMELREISERFGESFINVRHHYYRGLEKLRRNISVRRLRDRRL